MIESAVEKKNVPQRAVLTVVVALVLIVGGWVWLGGISHAAAIARQNASIATQLGNEGITGIGTPNASLNVVPFQVGTCTVNFQIVTHGKSLTLDLPYFDGTHRLIGATDTVTNAATATAVRTSLTTMLAANPKNRVCKS